MKYVLAIIFVFGVFFLKSQDSVLSTQKLNKGLLYLEKNSISKTALKLFTESIEADSNNAEAYYQKGILLITLGDEVCYFDSNLFRNGIVNLEKAIEKGYRQPKAYVKIAFSKARLEGEVSYEECIKLLEIAISKDPKNLHAIIRLIQFSKALEKTEKALWGYKKIVNIIEQFEPNDLDNLNHYEIIWLHRALSKVTTD